ncbi:uncharacterized protein J3D65DRAFT_51691 [Phyllosticta citribraziliensis]|uniref:Uncharacterized protein n=1 Tax=Phyllosticta citribraziliensis TaxID=989973 RepID=A0ABR1LDV2_9PEZI
MRPHGQPRARPRRVTTALHKLWCPATKQRARLRYSVSNPPRRPSLEASCASSDRSASPSTRYTYRDRLRRSAGLELRTRRLHPRIRGPGTPRLHSKGPVRRSRGSLGSQSSATTQPSRAEDPLRSSSNNSVQRWQLQWRRNGAGILKPRTARPSEPFAISPRANFTFGFPWMRRLQPDLCSLPKQCPLSQVSDSSSERMITMHRKNQSRRATSPHADFGSAFPSVRVSQQSDACSAHKTTDWTYPSSLRLLAHGGFGGSWSRVPCSPRRYPLRVVPSWPCRERNTPLTPSSFASIPRAFICLRFELGVIVELPVLFEELGVRSSVVPASVHTNDGRQGYCQTTYDLRSACKVAQSLSSQPYGPQTTKSDSGSPHPREHRVSEVCRDLEMWTNPQPPAKPSAAVMGRPDEDDSRMLRWACLSYPSPPAAVRWFHEDVCESFNQKPFQPPWLNLVVTFDHLLDQYSLFTGESCMLIHDT